MKKTNSNLILLNAFFVVGVVMSTILAAKIFTTGFHIGNIELYSTGGMLPYCVTFLCTDVIGEIWGKEEAKKAVWRGFYMQLFAVLLIWIGQILPAKTEEMQSVYVAQLGQSFIFCGAGLVAYLLSQSWDVYVFHKVRDRFKDKENFARYKWVWNNLSTCTSQIIDTLVYLSLAFGLGLGFFKLEGGIVLLIGMMIGQYLLKAVLALFDTPFFYLLTRNSKPNYE